MSTPRPSTTDNRDRTPRAIRHGVFAGLIALAGLTPPAHAVDGCLVLLCLAAPNWTAVPQCVPPIRQLFRDLALGRSFPSCAMAGAGSSATNSWARVPDHCPAAHQHTVMTAQGLAYRCDYTGAIAVALDGIPFSTVWWSATGESLTYFSDNR